MSQKIEAEDIFLMWLSTFRGDTEQFLAKARQEILHALVEMFYNNKIPLEEAKLFTSRVVLNMTTKEARKGLGKYKGWKETVEEDYKIMLVEYYLSDNVNTTSNNPSSVVNESAMIPEDSLIINWGKNKFENQYSGDIKHLSHQIGHIINTQFFVDVFESDWVLDGSENTPEWVKNY